MKFLTKINRNYILLLALVLLAVTIAGYFIFQAIILDDAKEDLMEQEHLIEKQILETGELSNIYPVIEVKKINLIENGNPVFKEIILKDEVEDELETYLEYSNEVKINESYYSIKLRQSSFESQDLIIILGLSLFILLLAAFGISFLITKKMNKTIWADFAYNLREIENFSLTNRLNINLKNSDIEEFDRLNTVIEHLTEKLKTDYLSLKDFTENASHEIQTPLSIVLLNLEEVLQKELTEDVFKKVVISINAIKRLSGLNQSLILLTKIENRQFMSDKMLIINDLIIYKVHEFDVLFEAKKLKLELDFKEDLMLIINEQLADLMVNNLLSNAIHHNTEGGSIRISVQRNEMNICNTGEPNSLTDETIFNRFTKGNSTSYGLGLAIVKKICENYNLEIHYLQNEFHCFTISKKL